MMSESKCGRFQCFLLEKDDAPNGLFYAQALHLDKTPAFNDLPDAKKSILTSNAKARILDDVEHCFVLWDSENEEPAGYTSIYFDIGSEPEFDNTYIAEKLRGRGLAKLLHEARELDMIENGKNNAYLEVNAHNVKSIRAASTAGFNIHRTFQDSQGRDWHEMRKEFQAPQPASAFRPGEIHA